MAQGNMAAAYAQGLRAAGRAVKAQLGFAFWRVADLNLAGSDALAEARAQRLDRRFLCRRAAGR